MRITLTLDDDLVEAIDKELRRRPTSTYKEVINELIRTDIYAPRAMKRAPKFNVRARWMGLHSGINYDDIGGLLENIEGATHHTQDA